MRRTRSLHASIYSDGSLWDEFATTELSEDSMFLYTYLSSCREARRSKFPGLFEFYPGIIRDRFRWSDERTKNALQELKAKHLVILDTTVFLVWLPRILFKYNKRMNSKHAKGWRAEWDTFADFASQSEVLRAAFYGAVRALEWICEQDGAQWSENTKSKMLNAFVGQRPSWFQSSQDVVASYIPSALSSNRLSIVVPNSAPSFKYIDPDEGTEMEARELTSSEVDELVRNIQEFSEGKTPKQNEAWDRAITPKMYPSLSSLDSHPCGPPAQRSPRMDGAQRSAVKESAHPSVQESQAKTKQVFRAAEPASNSSDFRCVYHYWPPSTFSCSEEVLANSEHDSARDTLPTGMVQAQVWNPQPPSNGGSYPHHFETHNQSIDIHGDTIDPMQDTQRKDQGQSIDLKKSCFSEKSESPSSLNLNLNLKREELREERNVNSTSEVVMKPTCVSRNSKSTGSRNTEPAPLASVSSSFLNLISKAKAEAKENMQPEPSKSHHKEPFVSQTTKDMSKPESFVVDRNKDVLEATPFLEQYLAHVGAKINPAHFFSGLFSMLERESGLPANASIVPYFRCAVECTTREFDQGKAYVTQNSVVALRNKLKFIIRDDEVYGYASGKTDGLEGTCAQRSSRRIRKANPVSLDTSDVAQEIQAAHRELLSLEEKAKQEQIRRHEMHELAPKVETYLKFQAKPEFARCA